MVAAGSLGGMWKTRRWNSRDLGAVQRRVDAHLSAPDGEGHADHGEAVPQRLGDPGERVIALHRSCALIVFSTSYPPSANHSHYASGRLKDTVRSWRTRAAWAYKAAGGTRLEGLVAMEIELYKPAVKTPYDIDNALRNVLNALKGVAYVDDDQVSLLTVMKMWPDGPGRAVVRVKKIGPAQAGP